MLKIGITGGELAGVGPELIVKALPSLKKIKARFFIYSNYDNLKKLSLSRFGKNPFVKVSSFNVKTKFNVFNIVPPLDIKNKKYKQLLLNSIKKITLDAKNKKISAFVTMPVNKSYLMEIKRNFTGHTSYIAELCAKKKPLMIMYSRRLTAGLITEHLPLKSVSGALTQTIIVKKTLLMDNFLKKLKIKNKKIGVLSLNPHGGEGGKIGEEEEKIIIPALKKLKRKGINVIGPLAPDSFFKTNCGAYMFMYHDQALVLFKYLYGKEGVNITWGLSVVRTSPDHGTAEDIKGTFKADGTSFLNALNLAISLSLK